jgi:hypothetical protein
MTRQYSLLINLPSSISTGMLAPYAYIGTSPTHIRSVHLSGSYPLSLACCQSPGGEISGRQTFLTTPAQCGDPQLVGKSLVDEWLAPLRDVTFMRRIWVAEERLLNDHIQ